MSINYCNLLLLKGESVGAVALDSLLECRQKVTEQLTTEAVKSLLSLNATGLTPHLTAHFQPKQQQKYIPTQTIDVILSLGFKYQIFPSQRDKANCSRFGYNNNHVPFIQSDEINFGCIGFISWIQIIGKLLRFEVVKAALEKNSCFLPANDQIQAEVFEDFREASLDWGLGVILIRESADTNWRNSDIYNLEDSRLGQKIQIDKAFEEQCTIFVNAHYDRGNAVPATCTSCPEDSEVARNDLYINFTSSGSDGISQGCNDPAPLGLNWQILTALFSFGFAHLGNFFVNRGLNVWIFTDASPAKVNNVAKISADNTVIYTGLGGVFGNVSWYLITSSDPGKALLFDTSLMEWETSGYFLTLQFVTMFISREHPWETLGDDRAIGDSSLCQIKYRDPENLTSISKSWN